MFKIRNLRMYLIALVFASFWAGYTFATNTVVVIPFGEAVENGVAPAGMVSAFNLNTCPSGWVKLNNARGRFIVGLNDGGTLGLTRGTAYGNGEQVNHNHEWSIYNATAKSWTTYSMAGSLSSIIDFADGITNTGNGFYPLGLDDTGITQTYYTSLASLNPPYIQLLYCEKA